MTEVKHDRVPARNLKLKITQLVLNSSNPETVLPKIAEALGEAFEAEYCIIVALAGDDVANAVSVRTAIDNAYWYSKKARSPLKEHLRRRLGNLDMAAILASSDPLEIPDVGDSQSHSSRQDSWEELPVKAILTIKTRSQGFINGVIAIMHSKTHHWKASEKERLSAVSESVAMAISQVNLQWQADSGAQYQALLNQLTMAIRNSTELDQILKLAIDGMGRTLRVDRGFILLLKYFDPLVKKSSSQKRLSKGIEATVVCEWSASSALPEKQNSDKILNQTFCLSKSQLWEEAFTNAPRPIAIADKQALIGDDINAAKGSIFDFNTMPALLLVPLESQDTVLGFLALQQSQPRTWLSEELELVELISAQMSTAILQFQTLRQTSALVEERTYQLQSILKVQAKLYEKTRQQVDQLRQLNQLKDEFIDTMSDQLRNPLASMRMAIRLLREPELSPELQSKYLDKLEQECNREISLINDILAWQEVKTKKMPLNLQKIDLKQKIEDLRPLFLAKWETKALNLIMDLPESASILQTDPDSIERILQELLTNAGKYSDSNTTVHICIDRQIVNRVPQIVLTVSNVGSPIPPEEQEDIFEQFRRGHDVSEQLIQGTGLGLALVKCSVEHLNGTISVSSHPLDESSSWLTSFSVTLPQI